MGHKAYRGWSSASPFNCVSLVLNIEGSRHHRTIRTFDRTIDVQVTWHQKLTLFFGKYWQFLCAGILFPIAASLIALGAKEEDSTASPDTGFQRGVLGFCTRKWKWLLFPTVVLMLLLIAVGIETIHLRYIETLRQQPF